MSALPWTVLTVEVVHVCGHRRFPRVPHMRGALLEQLEKCVQEALGKSPCPDCLRRCRRLVDEGARDGV